MKTIKNWLSAELWRESDEAGVTEVVTRGKIIMCTAGIAGFVLLLGALEGLLR